MNGAESVTYSPHSQETMEVQYINSNTVGITCSDNVAYSSVCNDIDSKVKENEYMVPCSGNFACSTTTRVSSVRREECSNDVYEEVQTTT